MMTKLMVGVDVSSKVLDVAFDDSISSVDLLQVPNTEAGITQLVDRIHGYRSFATAPAVLVIMEATGTYHERLRHGLEEAGIAVSIVNPLILRRYAQMKMQRTKSDQVDARMLARFGHEQTPEESRKQPDSQRFMRQRNTVIEALLKQRTALKNTLHALEQYPLVDPPTIEILQEQIEHLKRAIERLEEEQQDGIKQDYAGAYQLLRSIPGVGPRTASALLAYCGDLSTFATARQLIAYVGTNPARRYSGTSMRINGGISKMGNRRLRGLLYMGAFAARKHNVACKEMFERLTARGKKPKVAQIAVVNKMLRQIHAVLKSQQPFNENLALAIA